MAIDGQFDVNANDCGIFCFLAGDVSVGYLMTPAGPNDWFLGNMHLFASVGGAILGVTPRPEEPIDFLSPGPGWQSSLDLGACVSISGLGFVIEANTSEAFSVFARQASASAGADRSVLEQEQRGQATHGFVLVCLRQKPVLRRQCLRHVHHHQSQHLAVLVAAIPYR